LPSKASTSLFTIDQSVVAKVLLRMLFNNLNAKSTSPRSSLLKTLNQTPRLTANDLSRASALKLTPTDGSKLNIRHNLTVYQAPLLSQLRLERL
jgi:hypothetical protein